ncbi:TPA: WcaF family extracellular polysaccharide biosynthesis acetyltransferase [Escherichia coli]|uniref:WcaF family extracellular polysaccharide biosynthesis acetyltransferase n=1 Tax=Escherichia coli TaxID=562 RepID=UPI000E1FCB53|nr:WcaF family extracellular polysaccharide biosynthesis acetyltransferase [Escherichia coli]EIY9331114.1 colanic acid biosynthesis acetyltransferase WcaF [Escherichia coli]MCV5810950.1 WcaF family extracellular polysaccharide biosynthesis acetyltransferase [Escherichia coli]HBB8294656.1 colanic acid biosynthesis acetyltransferase WcaF [Escherichia coli]
MILSKYKKIYHAPKIKSIIWYVLSFIFFETAIPFPSQIKCFILKLMGAHIGKGVVIKPNVKIKYPWNLYIGNNSWLGEKVWIDNLDIVTVGNNCCISQGAYLLTGNHDYRSECFDLIISPITIENEVWVGAKAIVTPGVHLKTGAILAVNSVAASDLNENSVYQGNPATFKRKRYS